MAIGEIAATFGEVSKEIVKEFGSEQQSNFPSFFKDISLKNQNPTSLDISKETAKEVGEGTKSNFPDFFKDIYLEEKRPIDFNETKWSEDITEKIENREQYDVYKNAGLHEEEINGRKCLVKDINFDYVDEKTGMTNRELMAKGRAPIDHKTGEKIELHHMGQEYDSPFAELDENSEHGNGNHKILHPKTEDSWRNDTALKSRYQKEKIAHWKSRSGVNNI